MNTCLNLSDANFALGVRKPDLELSFTNHLDLAKKLDFIILLDMKKFA